MGNFRQAYAHGQSLEDQKKLVKKTFNKKILTVSDQIKHLEEKGMLFDDKKDAALFLQTVNYYRLKPYWIPFYFTTTNYNYREWKDNANTKHSFPNTIDYKDVINYYNFDCEFRNLIFYATAYIEITFKSQFANYLGMKYNAHVLMTDEVFKNSNFWENFHKRTLCNIEQYDETFLMHFKENYIEEFPPIWAHVEILNFGEIINLWDNLKSSEDKTKIVEIFGIHKNYILGYLKNIKTIRNYCAHHSRLWNRSFVNVIQEFKSDDPKITANWNTNKYGKKKIFNSLLVINYLLKQINPNFNLFQQVNLLIKKHKIADIDKMGFPSTWDINQ